MALDFEQQGTAGDSKRDAEDFSTDRFGGMPFPYPPTVVERERLLSEARAGNDRSFRDLVEACLGITALTAAAFAPHDVPVPYAIAEANALLVRLVRDATVPDPLLDLPRAISETLADRVHHNPA